jgi:hypothetical protein
MKGQSATGILREHAVEHQRVGVDVHVEGRAEALDYDDGAAAAVGHAVGPGPPPQHAEQRAHEDADDGPAQRMIPGRSSTLCGLEL